MSFLNPALLSALLPLLALPLVIHLLNRHFPTLLKFSSVEHIRETLARRSRLLRWRHLVLLLLRTAMLALLLLVFLKPVLPRFGSDASPGGERHVLLVLDHSLSMEHRGDGSTSRERAVHEAISQLGTLGADDAVNIVLLEQHPTSCFVDFSKNHAEAKRFLQALKPGLTRGDVNQANALAARLLSKRQTRIEVYYFSDFQRKNWANADFTALPPGARLFFVDAGPRRRDNRAVLEARPSETEVLAGDTLALDITIGNFAEQPFQDRVTVTLDKRLSFDQEAFIAPWSVGKFTVPVPLGMPGLHLCEVRLPADALETDNHFCLTVSVREKEEILIVSDEPTDKPGAAYFLKMALNPYEDLRGSLLPKVVPSSEITASRLAGVRKIFLMHLDRLGEAACAALAKSLFQGAGVIYFLDSPSDALNLAALETAMGKGTLPLQLTQWRSATNALTGAQQIVKGDFKSRFLKLFRGAGRQDLALLEFYDYWQARTTAAGAVVLAFTDGSPAMAVAGHGLGTLLLLNFSASERSGNLARQRLFPAWMQELVKAVSADEPPPSAYTLGEALQTEVWKNDMRDVDFLDPGGRPVTVKRELQGDRYTVSFAPEITGFYTLGAPRPVAAFGVNPSPDEADLRPVDRDLLPTALGAQQQAHFVAGREDYEDLARGRPIFHWWIGAALVLLLLENGFQILVRKAGRRVSA